MKNKSWWKFFGNTSVLLPIILLEHTTLFCSTTSAQSITTDGTLSPARTLQGPVYTIRQADGQTTGLNLFHSFRQFNLDLGEEVNFDSDSSVRNIITRVTGESASFIDGRISTTSLDVNLFLINPNGIVFGANASLDVGRSFVASTAESLVFQDGTRFGSVASTPLLTVSAPVGLQFGQSAGRIRIQGNGVASVGLQLLTGGTLAFVGGNISLEGGSLGAPGGRIEIGSLAAPGLVHLIGVERGWKLGYGEFQQFGNIRLSQTASLNADSLQRNGSIRLRGETVNLTDGSQINIFPSLGKQPSEISIRSEHLIVSNSASIGVLPAPIGARGANLDIDTGTLTVRTGGIVSSTSIIGASGNLTIQARESVDVLSDGAILADTFNNGQGGNLTISASNINIDGGLISAGTLGTGTSGTLRISAKNSIEIFNGTISTDSLISNQSAGDLTIQAPQVTVGEGGSITASTIGVSAGGSGGNINIQADQVSVNNRGRIAVNSIGQLANAGSVNISGNSLFLINQGTLEATTQQGNGGDVNLTLQNLLLLRRNSSISASAGTSQLGGAGGNIRVNGPLIVAIPSENSDITANAFAGKGGQVEISAQGIVGITPLTREALQTRLGTDNLEQLNPSQLTTSDITAISQTSPNLNGQVTINSSDTEPSRGLIELPAEVLDASQQIAQQCPAGGRVTTNEIGNFVVTGRGSLPPNPSDVLASEDDAIIWIEESNPTRGQGESNLERLGGKATEQATRSPQPIMTEAQGWVVGTDGKVLLVAQTPQATPYTPALSSGHCH